MVLACIVKYSVNHKLMGVDEIVEFLADICEFDDRLKSRPGDANLD